MPHPTTHAKEARSTQPQPQPTNHIQPQPNPTRLYPIHKSPPKPTYTKNNNNTNTNPYFIESAPHFFLRPHSLRERVAELKWYQTHLDTCIRTCAFPYHFACFLSFSPHFSLQPTQPMLWTTTCPNQKLKRPTPNRHQKHIVYIARQNIFLKEKKYTNHFSFLCISILHTKTPQVLLATLYYVV